MRLLLGIVIGVFSLSTSFLSVSWSSWEKESVTIRAPGLEGAVVECLNSAMQAHVRFEAQLCRRRVGWIDRCEAARSELHTIKYDGITESYRVVSDRFGDSLDAMAVGIPARAEAIRAELSFENLSLRFLGREQEELIKHPAAYISARTIFRCKGGSNRTLAHLSQFLTLGLVNVVESTSEWFEFSLHPGKEGEQIKAQESTP